MLYIPEHSNQRGEMDAMLVLGRGVGERGELSPQSRSSVELAVRAAEIALPRLIVFSGGRSWQQVAQDISPAQSEAQGMHDHAVDYIETRESRPTFDSMQFGIERDSDSTLANLVYSASIMNLQPGMRLGLVSDELHFLYGRPQYLAGKVFPGVDVSVFAHSTPYAKREAREELISTIITKAFMTGVRAGHTEALMRRQRVLECANRMIRG